MKAVVQRVTEARVTVDGEVVSEIGRGLLVLVGVEVGDTDGDAAAMAHKLAHLRIFPDDLKPMNVDVRAIEGEILVVSQFTLAADTSKGHRPSFMRAAPPDAAERLYEVVIERLRDADVPTKTGRFRASMEIALVNEGPVTIQLQCGSRG